MTEEEYALDSLSVIEDIVHPIIAPMVETMNGQTAYKSCVALNISVAVKHEIAANLKNNTY